eukprot:5386837-Alexandrium_andersonii.AAC.1
MFQEHCASQPLTFVRLLLKNTHSRPGLKTYARAAGLPARTNSAPPHVRLALAARARGPVAH